VVASSLFGRMCEDVVLVLLMLVEFRKSHPGISLGRYVTYSKHNKEVCVTEVRGGWRQLLREGACSRENVNGGHDAKAGAGSPEWWRSCCVLWTRASVKPWVQSPVPQKKKEGGMEGGKEGRPQKNQVVWVCTR
jgi:hypothetical protein